jgi:hypothetical protein
MNWKESVNWSSGERRLLRGVIEGRMKRRDLGGEGGWE